MAINARRRKDSRAYNAWEVMWGGARSSTLDHITFESVRKFQIHALHELSVLAKVTSSRDSNTHHLFSLQLYCREPTSANALITKPLLTLLTLLMLLLMLLTLLLTLLTLLLMLLTLLLTFLLMLRLMLPTLLALLSVNVSHPGSLCGCTPTLQCCHLSGMRI